MDTKNPEKEKIFAIVKEYLQLKNDSIDLFWSDEDKARYPGRDLIKNAMGLGGHFYKFKYDCNILSISEIGSNYLVKCAFYSIEQDSSMSLFAIVNYILRKDGGSYKFSNYLNYYTANWLQKKVGRIIYHYPTNFPFDLEKANRANTFLDSLGKWFSVSNDTLNYYIPVNCTEGLKMAGFEYAMGEGRELNLCGYYDNVNKIIYSNFTQGELYKHELIHSINSHYPNAHSYLLSGIAAYIDDAGSLGKPERYHIKRYLDHIEKAETDLNNFCQINYFDETTFPLYVFGATICNAILRKGGLQLLKKAMSKTKNDDQLISFLVENFNIKDFNSFFKMEFKIYLEQPDVLMKTY